MSRTRTQKNVYVKEGSVAASTRKRSVNLENSSSSSVVSKSQKITHAPPCDPNTEREYLKGLGYNLASGKLGSGKYCKVRLASERTTGKKFAVKIVDTRKLRETFVNKFLPREIEIWPKLLHPHIVRLYHYFKCGTKHFMVIEYMQGGDLLSKVQKEGAQASARHFLLQILSAVEFMHGLNVAHRDLKLENIMLDRFGNVKLTDFGFCRKMSEHCLSETYCGSKAYSPPEVLQGVPYDPFVGDIWSLGVIAFILLTGYMPFDEKVKQSELIDNQLRRRYSYGASTPQHIITTIDAMLTFDWKKRPTIQEVKRLPWFLPDLPPLHPSPPTSTTFLAHQVPEARTVFAPIQATAPE